MKFDLIEDNKKLSCVIFPFTFKINICNHKNVVFSLYKIIGDNGSSISDKIAYYVKLILWKLEYNYLFYSL